MFHVKQFEKLTAYADENGLKIKDKELEQFQILCDLLIRKNREMNLTAITDPEEIEIRHFIDSLMGAPVLTQLWSEMLFGKQGEILPEDAGFRLVDIGTGAGFPGLPLKIVFPKAEFLLLDSLRKRIDFVDLAIRETGLKGIRAEAARAEEAAKAGNVSRETFDFCTTRAVADTAVLAEYCLPMVRVGGYCILYKSGDYEKELTEAEKAISVMGGKVADVREESLYGSGAGRSLIILRKIKATPDKYPRRPGKPSKSPIK